MNIETTTCISNEHYERLQILAKAQNMSLRTFISGLISFAADNKKIPVQYFKKLRYRKRYEASWRRLHLVLFEDEYEFFMDVKKLWKLSLARIIAFCMDNVVYEYLDFLSREKEKEDYYTDNYRYSGYTFETGSKCDIFYITVYWGPHPEIVQKATT
ncbi:MAG: hypothetical protein WHV26_10135 [Spirochaetota bacterium]